MRRCIRTYMVTFSAPTAQRVFMWRLSCEVTCRCTKTLRTLVKLKCMRHAGKSLQRTGRWNDVVHTKYSSNAFVDRATGLALEQSLGCARGEEVRAEWCHVCDCWRKVCDYEGKVCVQDRCKVCDNRDQVCTGFYCFKTIFSIQMFDLSLNSEFMNTV